MDLITNDSFVTLAYSATDADGNLIDDGKKQLTYVHGGYRCIFQPIEAALEGKGAGDCVTVRLLPGDAFGEYDAELVSILPVEELPQPLAVGMQMEGRSVEGDPQATFLATVTDIADGKAVLDGNHPLAGLTLIFSCTVVAIRPATPDEIAAAREGEE